MKSETAGRISIPEESVVVTIDPARSFIAGSIDASAPERITWSIEVEGAEASIAARPGESEQEAAERQETAHFLTQERCYLEVRELQIPVSHWIELDGVAAAADATGGDVFPIEPETAWFCYATEHHLAQRSHIRIGPRLGTSFRVRWRFTPERYEGEASEEAQLDAILPLREICVYFPSRAEVSEQAARRHARRFAQENELGDATINQNWVHIAVTPRAADG